MQEQKFLIVISAPVPEIIEELADTFVVLRQGQVVANETLEGLQRLTGIGGGLSEVLASLTSPETLDNVDHYFAGSSS